MRAELVEFADLAPGVRHFVFRAPELERLEFVPGQFVSLSAIVKGKEITRAYSLASPPNSESGNTFDLCLNRVEDGVFSPYLFSMTPGDAVEMRPPLGGFVLRQPLRESVFIATGTGIAPFRSMLPVALNATQRPRITLIFGVRYQSHLLYSAEFETFAQQYSQFKYWPTLTQPGPEWTGRTGRVQAHLFEALAEARAEAGSEAVANAASGKSIGAVNLDVDVYLCGMKAMVDEVRNLLKHMGYDRKQIRSEKYD